MTHSRLTNQEIQRLERAANAMGFPWQPIAERPRAARNFIRRVEAELAGTNRAAMPRVARTTTLFNALFPRLSLALA